MNLSRLNTICLLSIFLFATPCQAKQNIYRIDEKPNNTVQFTSDAPIEIINGTTHAIKGKISYDDAFRFDAKHPFKISFDVDLDKIDTGIPLRNEHMRDQYLETKKYSKATFIVKQVQVDALPPFKQGQVVNIKATGQFSVHGKSVAKTIPVQVTYHPSSLPGDTIRIQAKFPVTLEEHHIQRPELVFQKLAETVFITVDAYGKASTK